MKDNLMDMTNLDHEEQAAALFIYLFKRCAKLIDKLKSHFDHVFFVFASFQVCSNMGISVYLL